MNPTPRPCKHVEKTAPDPCEPCQLKKLRRAKEKALRGYVGPLTPQGPHSRAIGCLLYMDYQNQKTRELL